MQNKLTLLLLLLFISHDVVLGKKANNTKSLTYKTIQNVKHNIDKRSLKDDGKKVFFLGKDSITDDSTQYDNSFDEIGRNLKLQPIIEKELPFWGTRGRRESSSEETVPDVQLPTAKNYKYSLKSKLLNRFIPEFEGKLLREEVETPFWGNRGRRDSDESKEDIPEDLFWANRGRRQEDGPFWGTRGRRQEDGPFWGNRGRRDDFGTSFWDSREINDYDEPFWGNRGRRQEPEPFWGNRGRRETYEPFWGSRGKKKLKFRYLNEDTLFPPESQELTQTEIKKCLSRAINKVRHNIEKIKRDDIQTSLWGNRDPDNRLKTIIKGTARGRMHYIPKTANTIEKNELKSKTFEQNTMHDDTMFVEEPHYILVERSSRSSGEEDPFFITRGKKYKGYKLAKTDRDRRGALEEIVKSVRNDPYYIARGKKDGKEIMNSTRTESQYLKTKELICATVDLLSMSRGDGKVKREVVDNERDRRTILKKLALQLQMDPYFVSRGKKKIDTPVSSDDLEQFMNQIVVMCNSNSM